MRWPWRWPWQKVNGGEAKVAREAAEAKLRAARNQRRNADQVAQWLAAMSPEEYAARVAAAFGRRR